MATDHPSDPVPPAGHGPHPAGHDPVPPAEPPLEVVPLGSPTSPEPEPLPDDALDDDLDELVELPASADDDVIDLGAADLSDAPSPSAAFSGTSVPAGELPPPGPGDVVALGPLPADPEDALAGLPPVAPTAPASGWLDVASDPSLEFFAPPAGRADEAGESDVFTGLRADRHESDVLNGLGAGPGDAPGHSHIFGPAAGGSSRFEIPADRTDVDGPAVAPSPEPASGGLYTDFGPPGVPASDVFAATDPDPPPASAAGRPGNGATGSGPFTGPHRSGQDVDSSVNLSSPSDEYDALPAGPDSSIFTAPLAGGDAPLDVEELLPPASADDVTDLVLFDQEPAADGAADVFRTADQPAADPDRVTFEHPTGSDGRVDPQVSGQIDWRLPPNDLDVSRLLSGAEAARAGIPDDLGSNATPDEAVDVAGGPSPLDETAGVVIAAPEPIGPPPRAGKKTATGGAGRGRPSPAVADGPRGRGGAVGWLAGGAVGLLTGVGACAGAYFGGLVPNGDAAATKPAVTSADTGAVARQQAEDRAAASLQEATAAKQQAEKAEAGRTAVAAQLAAETRRAGDAEQRATQAVADRQKLTTDLGAARTARVTAERTAADAKAAADAATVKFQADAKAMTEEFTRKVAEAQAAADTQAKRADAATADATAATARLKTADDTVARILLDLKANKLVGDGDDAAAALAKLPDVLKQASAALASADVKKAADALLAAQTERNAAQGEVIAANARAAAAAADAKKAVADAEKAVAAARAQTAAKVRDAVDAAKAEAGATIAQLTQKADRLAADVKAAEAEMKRKLAEKDEEAARQLADARAGRAVTLTSAEARNRDRAAEGFAAGVRAYAAARYADAEAALDESAKLDGSDARVWYFLGLARYAQGKPADAAFKKGGELEARGRPNPREIGVALEGVTGPARRALDAYRP